MIYSLGVLEKEIVTKFYAPPAPKRHIEATTK
jgi:hypothetical protein